MLLSVQLTLILILLIVILITVLGNRKDRRNWKIWKSASEDYLEHMNIVAGAKASFDGFVNINHLNIIRYANDMAYEMTGLKRSEIKDHNLSILFSSEDLNKISKFRYDKKSGVNSIECELITFDKKTIPVEVTVKCFEHESQEFTTITFRDISHRRANEATHRLIESNIKEEYDLISFSEEMLKTGTWTWDLTKDPDVVRYSNGFARLFDVKPGGTMTAAELMSIVDKEDRDRVNVLLVKAVQENKEYEVEYRVVRRNDRKDLIKCAGRPVTNHKGKTIHVKGTIQLLKEDVQ